MVYVYILWHIYSAVNTTALLQDMEPIARKSIVQPIFSKWALISPLFPLLSLLFLVEDFQFHLVEGGIS